MNIEEKIRLSQWMCDVNRNNKLLLSGSLMMYVRGIKLDREPKDLDFVLWDDEDKLNNIILPPFSNILEVEEKGRYNAFIKAEYNGVVMDIMNISDYDMHSLKYQDDFDYDTFKENPEYTDSCIKRNGYNELWLGSIKGLLDVKRYLITSCKLKQDIEKHRKDCELIKEYIHNLGI